MTSPGFAIRLSIRSRGDDPCAPRPVLMTLLARLAPAAEAAIQIDHGIAGARLGNSRATCEGLWASRRRPRRAATTSGAGCSYRFPGKITGLLPGARAGQLGPDRRARRPHCAAGIGVGSTEAEAHRFLKGLTCEDIGANLRTCHTGDFVPGRAGDRLPASSNGKVESVTVALVVRLVERGARSPRSGRPSPGSPATPRASAAASPGSAGPRTSAARASPASAGRRARPGDLTPGPEEPHRRSGEADVVPPVARRRRALRRCVVVAGRA